MSRELAEPRSYAMAWALGGSVVIHALLLLLSVLFPFRMDSPEPPHEESVLRFTFAPITDRDVAARAKGAVPVQTPPSAVPAAPSARPQPAVPPITAPAPLPTPVSPEETEQAAREKETAAELPGVRLDEGGIERQGEGERAESTADKKITPPPETLDVERALRDFRRALRQPAPPTEGAEGRRGSGRTQRPELPQLPVTGFQSGNLEFESRDYDWTDYARQIHQAIWRAWHNRLYVMTDVFERWGFEKSSWDLAHNSKIRFTIQRNGQVSDIVLETPSGCYPLDDSALDALAEVILPPLPADFPRDQETVHGRFIATGDIRSMRRNLAWLKRLGFF